MLPVPDMSKLNSIKNRTLSSTKWLTRRINDDYITMAKKELYRSRAAFKLKEIAQKFLLFSSKIDITVVDIGAAPGSWLQILRRECSQNSTIIGVDIQKISTKGLSNIHIIEGNILDQETITNIDRYIDLAKYPLSLVLSDMAPTASGDRILDHIRLMELAEVAKDFAIKRLAENGNFICKLIRGGQEQDFFNNLKKHFTKLKMYKPPASYTSSAEIFLIAIGYKKNCL